MDYDNIIERYKEEFKTNRYVLIIENDTRALLRSIPILELFGINKFTYPFSWIGVDRHNNKFTPVLHEYYHIDEVKKAYLSTDNSFCMITEFEKYDSMLPQASLSSMFNIKKNAPFYIVLNEKDAKVNMLRGFVRPLIETEIINENFYEYFSLMYNDIIDYFKHNSEFRPLLNQTNNLYLEILAFLYYEVLGVKFREITELLIYLLDNPVNPFSYYFMTLINNSRSSRFDSVQMKYEKLKNACFNLKYHFELNNKEVSKISEIVIGKYERDELEQKYWLDTFLQNESFVLAINKKINELIEPLRGVAKYQWKEILGLIS